MANRKEQTELFKTIWAIANDLRGAVDGWTFKAYVLGAIFYRYISEDICRYVAELQAAAGVPDFDYSTMSDEEAETAHEMIVDEKGYFILPSQLFKNVLKTADQDENLNNHLSKIFRDIESSPGDKPSKEKIAGLFSDFAVDNTMIGNTVAIRNKLLAKLLHRVDEMDLSQHLEDNNNDTFGDAYEFLMKMYASQAGKSGGEFFTPQEVSELLAEIAAYGTEDIKRVYDPACGSGSLLLKFQKIHGRTLEGLKFYGQEINPTTYNLCRSNMFLHHVNYNDFDIQLNDTLLYPEHIGMVKEGKGAFDCIVSNPPYSLKWVGKENPLLMNDPRYADAGVLAPASAADLAFVLHMYYHLKDTGCCAIVEFPGILFRSGAEQKIREYLLKENAIDSVIQLPENLFYGVPIATCIIVLKKQGRRAGDDKVLFVDASREFCKEGSKNYLSEKNKEAIFGYYKARKNIQNRSRLVSTSEIIENESVLTVSRYVEQEYHRETININEVNNRIDTLIAAIIRGNLEIQNLISNLTKNVSQKMVEIGSVCEFKRGSVITKKDAKPGDIPVIAGGQKPSYYHNSANRNGESITVAGSGAYAGFVSYWNQPIFVSDAFTVEPSNVLIPKFLYHCLKLNQKKIYELQKGAGVPHVHGKDIAKLLIPLPPIEEQKRIVQILDCFDNSIKEFETMINLREKQYEFFCEKLLTFE